MRGFSFCKINFLLQLRAHCLLPLAGLKLKNNWLICKILWIAEQLHECLLHKIVEKEAVGWVEFSFATQNKMQPIKEAKKKQIKGTSKNWITVVIRRYSQKFSPYILTICASKIFTRALFYLVNSIFRSALKKEIFTFFDGLQGAFALAKTPFHPSYTSGSMLLSFM